MKPFTTTITSNSCEGVQSGVGMTPYDQANGLIYSRQRLTKEKCDALTSSPSGPKCSDGSPAVIWRDTYADKTVPYRCPDSLGLTGPNACVHGHCAIVCKEECDKVSSLPYNENTGDIKAGNVYTEWRPDTRGDNQPHCYLGNWMLRRWCTVPSTRNPPGNDAAKFDYNTDTGKCSQTEQYCKTYGLSWDADSKTCYEPLGETILESLFGQTVTRGVFYSSCPKLSDKRYKENVKLLAKNWAATGVNLYLFQFTPEGIKLHPEYSPIEVGFLAEEIEQVWPASVTTNDGRKYIDIKFDHLQKDKRLRRVYNLIRAVKPITSLILKSPNILANKAKRKI